MTKATFKAIMWLIAFAAALVLLLTRLDLIVLIFNQIVSVLSPFLIGFAIAYVVNIPFTFFYNKAFAGMDKTNKVNRNKWDVFVSRLRTPLSLLVSFALFFSIIALLLGIVIPQVSESLQGFFDNFNTYYISFQEFVFGVAGKFGLKYDVMSDVFADINQLIAQYTGTGTNATDAFEINNIIQKFADFFFPHLFDITKNIYTVVYNFLISIIVAIYYLANKKMLVNQCKKICYALIPQKHLGKVMRIADLCNNMVGKFLYGKMIDSVIIGIICFIGLSILRIDYALLLSVFVAVTNMIPFFGPIIGAIPGVVILLLTSPIDAVWFVLFVIVLQQFDGNYLGPKILGDSIGISGFWIMVSVLVGGGLFGFVGLLLGVPVFAVIYFLVGEKINDRLVRLGYLSADKVRVDPLPKVAYEDGHIIEEKNGSEEIFDEFDETE